MPAQRIVTLLPSATEIVAALGALDRLVGVTHACDHPRRVTALPRLTSTRVRTDAHPGAIDRDVREMSASGVPLYDVDDALLMSLAPEVIVTQALCDVCAVHEADVQTIAQRMPTTPRVVTLTGTSIDGIIADMQRVAAAIDAMDEAEEIALGMRARLRSIHDRLKAARAPRPRVAVLEWTDPPFTGGHWVPEMVARAGGVDALAKPGEHSRAIALEEVARADPDLVIFAPCGYDLSRATREAASVLATDAWSWARARSCWAIDANALASRPGPRVIDGVEVFAQIAHPDLFGTPPADRASPLSEF